MLTDPLWLRALKGAPLSCLAALSARRIPCAQPWLAIATGYHKEAVAAALGTLHQFGLACRISRVEGWVISMEGARLLAGALHSGDLAGDRRGADDPSGGQTGGGAPRTNLVDRPSSYEAWACQAPGAPGPDDGAAACSATVDDEAGNGGGKTAIWTDNPPSSRTLDMTPTASPTARPAPVEDEVGNRGGKTARQAEKPPSLCSPNLSPATPPADTPGWTGDQARDEAGNQGGKTAYEGGKSACLAENPLSTAGPDCPTGSSAGAGLPASAPSTPPQGGKTADQAEKPPVIAFG
jgi:hypothetical protein